jgi:3-oxoacyl-[acyl-carrier protein] reductase
VKNIVITGASRGIGAELGKLLAAGNKVLLMSRNLKSLQALKKKYPSLNIEKIDLSSSKFKTEFKTIVSRHFKTVDVLINNAGFLVAKPVEKITRKEIDQSFNTNIMALIEACQVIIPFMKKNGGHIVNISSMGGFQGSVKFPGLSVYSSSKAAVTGFSEALSEELKETSIKVNCLALGAVQTEMLEEAFPGYKAPVTAKKMAEFIADFALNKQQWINGKTIPVSLSTP